ncbi:hypothetical protein [Rhodococcus pyridinivorans]|uniref:hypothetical protein n=1 Tax=Rhodococcus pyridinivorans TaxID=103816 RepID=UPI002284E429|nr:hypothetical protein [Rhodococcus pyridinivorans]WAL49949.1 hypothetical protein OQN32_28895 [Rhodococcus pyridinivorans]
MTTREHPASDTNRGTGSRPAAAVRDRYLPLPTREDGYRQILLLGTTGAGKTTVVRQLLGTDPDNDRFPSTSTAKTTVSDTEIVLAPGPFHAVVTFFARDEVVRHLEECASRAAVSILRGLDRAQVREHLLDHEQQRFRFSYVLGRTRTSPTQPEATESDPFDVFDDPEPGLTDTDPTGFGADPQALPTIDLTDTDAVIDRAIDTLHTLVATHRDTARRDLGVTGPDDEQDLEDLLEEELDRLLRTDPRFDQLIASLLAEIDKRFTALSIGRIDRGDDHWPQSWTWKSDDRTDFLRAVNRFTSNYAPLFGHLLSPLVDGIRVAGPFGPRWNDGTIPPLVLIDGEGLGHTPTSAAAPSMAVADQINTVDIVLLVDHAAQPMQAAPAAAIRSILTSGNVDKLVFCFTHFDEVTGDNLATPQDRAGHVLGSANNLLAALRADFHHRDAQALQRRLKTATLFLSRIDKPLDPRDPEGKVSIRSFRKLLDVIDAATERPDLGPGRPIYDTAELRRAVTAAIGQFHRRWDAVLGLTSAHGVTREHWTRIKALSKRFAEGSADQYDTLRPSAELRELIKEELYKQLDTPQSWKGHRPDDTALSAIVNEFAQAVARRLNAPIRQRLSVEAQPQWQRGYVLHGSGSALLRAEHIAQYIFDPYVSDSPSEANRFLTDLLTVIEEAADEVDVTLL